MGRDPETWTRCRDSLNCLLHISHNSVWRSAALVLKVAADVAALSIPALSFLAQGAAAARREGGRLRAGARTSLVEARRVRRHEPGGADSGHGPYRQRHDAARFPGDLRIFR